MGPSRSHLTTPFFFFFFFEASITREYWHIPLLTTNVMSWHYIQRTNELLRLNFHYFISKRQHSYSNTVKHCKTTVKWHLCYTFNFSNCLSKVVQNYCVPTLMEAVEFIYPALSRSTAVMSISSRLSSLTDFSRPFPMFLYASRKIGTF